MRVYISSKDGSLAPLKRRVELEGDELSSLRGADVILEGAAWDEIPAQALKAFDMDVNASLPVRWIAVRQFSEEFGNQTVLGIPFDRLMNDDLGPSISAGLATKFVQSEFLDKQFAKTRNLFDAQKFNGYITISFNKADPVKVETGIPYNGIYNLLEGTDGTVAEFLQSPPRLYESWVGNLLVSRAPYPYATENGRVRLKGLSQSVERHFWAYPFEEVGKKTYAQTGTRVGIATAWSRDNLREVGQRLYVTCNAVHVPDRQYRTDFYWHVCKRYAEVRDLGIL